MVQPANEGDMLRKQAELLTQAGIYSNDYLTTGKLAAADEPSTQELWKDKNIRDYWRRLTSPSRETPVTKTESISELLEMYVHGA